MLANTALGKPSIYCLEPLYAEISTSFAAQIATDILKKKLYNTV